MFVSPHLAHTSTNECEIIIQLVSSHDESDRYIVVLFCEVDSAMEYGISERYLGLSWTDPDL